MELDRLITVVVVVTGLITALSPTWIAMIQARGKRGENENEKEKTNIEGRDKLIDQLQEQLEKSIEYNDALEKKLLTYQSKIQEYESERGLIIKKVEAQDERIAQLEKELADKNQKLEDAYHQIAVVEENGKNADRKIEEKVDKLEKKTGELDAKIVEKKDEERRGRGKA